MIYTYLFDVISYALQFVNEIFSEPVFIIAILFLFAFKLILGIFHG